MRHIKMHAFFSPVKKLTTATKSATDNNWYGEPGSYIYAGKRIMIIFIFEILNGHPSKQLQQQVKKVDL